MRRGNACTNMNHGRSNVPVNFCPECGQRFDSNVLSKCNTNKHSDFRRQRLNFCTDCGVKLSVGATDGKR